MGHTTTSTSWTTILTKGSSKNKGNDHLPLSPCGDLCIKTGAKVEERNSKESPFVIEIHFFHYQWWLRGLSRRLFIEVPDGK